MIPINKPKLDKRQFYGGKLDNGVKYALVHDEHLEKSFVCVTVKIGSYANPKEYNGIAHFLEHMLFMGSKKYPNENHYSDRLNELGGSSNAYTGNNETVYYFNVFDNGLAEIFDIFSRFFIDPLFNIDSVNREIKAVHSEHMKNINNDFWKIYQLGLYLSNKDSQMNTFPTGSLNTLNKPDIRKQVIEFYNKYYKPRNISISIASSKSIKSLEKIISSTFGKIKDSIPFEFELTKPFYSNNLNKTFHIKTGSKIFNVSYLWEIPKLDSFIHSHDFNILEQIIRNKSENGLYFKLISLGYLNTINSEIQYEGTFSITLILTEEGFKHLEEIDTIFFSYLNHIFSLNIQEYALYYQKINQINFNYLTKFDNESLCNLLAVNHLYYPTENIFDGEIVIRKIKKSSEYLSLFMKYIKDNNFIKIIASQKYKGTNNYIELREYTDTQWSEVKHNNINDNFIKFQKDSLVNSYIDINVELIPNLDKYEIPTLITEKQWYGGYSKFGEPNVFLYLQFNNNKYFDSSTNYILTNISCSILNLIISTFLNKPLETFFTINLYTNVNNSSIIINIDALNDITKLNLFMNELGNIIFNLDNYLKKISQTLIDNFIVTIKNNYLNTNYLNPWEYSSFTVLDSVFNNEYSVDELINAVNSIDYIQIKKYLSNILYDSSLTTFTYGNIYAVDIKNLFDKFNKYFFNNSYPLPNINQIESKIIVHPNIKETSNCVTYYYFVGKFIPKDFILLNLCINILTQKFFNELRTEKQLGYLVRMGINVYRDNFYIMQKIQSDKSVEFIEENINLFNKKILLLIKDSDFNAFVKTLQNNLSHPDNSLNEKFARYKPEISLRYYLFNRREILLDKLSQITKNDLIDFVKNIINDKNKVKFIVTAKN